MKRACIIILIVLLVLLIALTCIRYFTKPRTEALAPMPDAAATPDETPPVVAIATPEPTQVPTPTPEPEPASEPGVVRANGTGAIMKLLPRGYQAEITGERGDYYIIALDGAEAFVEKRFIRPDAEEDYQCWKGVAKANAVV